ncbi:sialidase family protein [uncultured Paludibaculum sp.]|uniref:sialidase family protein n=1 Tax=uncultured Paludibaculum sp. TaxID=1765020 RepID=UPI002AAB2FB8|nr:sialidase family protein [uncultured Paludibaculum sp.]
MVEAAPARNGILLNKPTVLRSGEWLFPVSVWQQPARASIAPPFRHDLGAEVGANVWITKDRGGTFSMLGQAQLERRIFDEHMLVERRDGQLWMLVRTLDGISGSTSTDRGKTWTAGKPSGIPHVNSRFFIRRLTSGSLLLVTHNPPDGKTRSHLTAHVSDDDGKTWIGGLLIDERVGVSYPDGVQAPDGVISVIYDFARTREKQILMATFTEEDVRHGQWTSKSARQRVLVNQAKR